LTKFNELKAIGGDRLRRLERTYPIQILFQFFFRLPQIHGPLGVESEIGAVSEQPEKP
jgi:hypothetical protein